MKYSGQPPELLNTRQVCARLDCGRTKLTSMVNSGEFPAPRKLGRRNRWLRQTVDQWIEDHWGDSNDPERN